MYKTKICINGEDTTYVLIILFKDGKTADVTVKYLTIINPLSAAYK